MSPRSVLSVLALVLAASLVGAPVTMHDWGQQAHHSASQLDAGEQVDEEVPVLQYDSLSPAAQKAVRGAIETSEYSYTIYGAEDFPEEFFYSDYAAPGSGEYVVEYEGDRYRLYTMAGGGFPFVYWIMELPFVVFGILLALAGIRLEGGDERPATVAVATAAGAGVHLLGPELDFPLLSPGQFVALGVVLAVSFAAWLARGLLPEALRAGVDGA